MTKPTLTEYHGYKITSVLSDDWMTAEVKVFDPRFPRAPVLYKTTNIGAAWKWIDAYRDGAQWAVEACL